VAPTARKPGGPPEDFLLKAIIPSSAVNRSGPEVTFQKFGLRSPGLWRGASVETSSRDLAAPARFCNALEELGGLYAAFGQFLAWRADLLRADYLGRLRHIRAWAEPIPASEVARILSSELGPPGDAMAQALEGEPCWNTSARCAYRTQYRGRTVAVQLARDPIPDSAFESFEKGLLLIEEERVQQAIRPAIRARFREWMRLSDSPARERAYLDALYSIREKTLAQYPVLIPEISTETVLCFEWVEGELLAAAIARGSPPAVQRAAECVLEQFCMIAVVDADFDPESMVITPSGRLALRRANRMVAIPPQLTNAGLKYVSAVLASNAPAAAHMLAKLSGGAMTNLESRLLDELSNLEPELKVNLQFPASAAIFEGNWRALERTGVEKPLFLDSMHRNLIAAGYWNAEAAAPPAPASDFIAEAQWPVLDRMLRTRFGDMATRETASDGLIGSGLLFFESLRQFNRLAEGLRENDLSLGVDVQTDDDPAKTHQRIRSGIFIGMLLVVFLVCLRFAVSAEGAWSTAFSAVAIATAFALFWFVSRFD
jgi:hypothetical protein